jgi:hypothetical protein
MTATVYPLFRERAGASHQRGLVLMLVLIVLGILALAGAAVMRSVDIGNTIAGNHSFHQSAMHASDRAVTLAIANMQAIVNAGGSNADRPNQYFSNRQTALDARGFPSTIDWSAVGCVNERGGVVSGSCTQDDGGYKVQYVIERLCTEDPAAGSTQSVRAVCEHDVELPGSVIVDPQQIPVHYRVIVRVRGPRNTEGWYEALAAGPPG